MNLIFWDLYYYGDNDLQQYKDNLDWLFNDIMDKFFLSLLFIWNVVLFFVERCKGGFFWKGFFIILVEKIKIVNKFVWLVIIGQKKIYLDLFIELRNKENFIQVEDGIYWGMCVY